MKSSITELGNTTRKLTENTNGQIDETIRLVEAILLIVIMLAGIIGNIMMCMVTFRRRPFERSRTYTFLGNLAIAELGVSVFSIPFSIITSWKGKWVLGPQLCEINGFINAFLLAATVYSMTVISIHKYFTIVHPLKGHLTRKRVTFLITLSWVISFLCALWPLVGWSKFTYKPNTLQCGLAIPTTKEDYSYYFFLAVVVYTIPTAVNVYAYTRIFKAIHQHRRRTRKFAIVEEVAVQAQKRLIITLCIVFISYVISWTPFGVYAAIQMSGTEWRDEISTNYLTAAYIFGFANCAHNPIIFAFRNGTFRQGFKNIITKLVTCCRKNKLKLSRELSAFSLASPYLNERRSSNWYIEKSDWLTSDIEKDARAYQGEGDLENTSSKRLSGWIESML